MAARTTPDTTRGRRAQAGLAPPHVGEILGAVLLGTAVIAFGALILSLAVIARALSLEADYAGTLPPPNLGEIARTQIITGVGVLLAAVAQAALVVAIVLYDWRPARPLSAALDATIAVIALYLGLHVLTAGPVPDMVVTLALLAVGAFFTAATVVHVVQLRLGLAADAD